MPARKQPCLPLAALGALRAARLAKASTEYCCMKVFFSEGRSVSGSLTVQESNRLMPGPRKLFAFCGLRFALLLLQNISKAADTWNASLPHNRFRLSTTTTAVQQVAASVGATALNATGATRDGCWSGAHV